MGSMRTILVLGLAGLAAGAAFHPRAVLAQSQGGPTAEDEGYLRRLETAIRLIQRDSLFIQSQGEGLGMVTLEEIQNDAANDVAALSIDLELEDTPESRRAREAEIADSVRARVQRLSPGSKARLPELEALVREAWAAVDPASRM